MLDKDREAASLRDRLTAGLLGPAEAPAIGIRLSRGRLIVDGEIPSVATKRHLLERAAHVSGVSRVIDRLRVLPVRRMADAEIRNRLLKALVDEPAFSILAIREKARGRTEYVRTPRKCSGMIEYEARDGVAILHGAVPGLGHKRLAGVLAWWVPGTRDVVNGITVTPAEEDSDDEILDAVRLALDKDPQLAFPRVRVSVSNRVVTLSGSVPGREAADRAERDAWYVFGVDDVVNRLTVQS